MTDNKISSVVNELIKDSSNRVFQNIDKNIDSLRGQYSGYIPPEILNIAQPPKPPEIPIPLEVLDIPQKVLSQITIKETIIKEQPIIQQITQPTIIKETIRETSIRRLKTEVINKTTYPVNNLENVVSVVDRTGTLRELVLVSPILLDINIYVDGNIITYYNTDFADLQTIYTYSDTFTANQNLSGDYVVTVKKIHFLNSISVDVLVKGRTTLKNLFAVIDTEEEVCHQLS
jgi:hypothetical protein